MAKRPAYGLRTESAFRERGTNRKNQRWSREGRTILLDGEEAFTVTREGHKIMPADLDDLTKEILSFLNRHYPDWE